MNVFDLIAKPPAALPPTLEFRLDPLSIAQFKGPGEITARLVALGYTVISWRSEDTFALKFKCTLNPKTHES